MRKLEYVSGTGSIHVQLDADGVFAGTAASIRGRAWSYTVGYRSLSGISRDARECEIELKVLDRARANTLRRVADRDMMEGTPGTIIADGWSQRAYIVKAEPSGINEVVVTMTLTVVLLDGVWRKPHTVEYLPLTVSADSYEYLDLPYDLPYDLGIPLTTSFIEAGEWLESPVKLTIYGTAVNPAIRIGESWYKVDATVPEGGYMTIDSISRTVTITDADGAVTDAFAKAHRGSGLGSGEYIFEPLPTGSHEVAWDMSFGFDLTWYEEEGEPPWC